MEGSNQGNAVIRAMTAVDELMGRVTRYLTGLAVLIQMVVVFTAVTFRYVFHSPLVWGDELARYLLVFITFIGGYTAMREGMLAKIDLLIEAIPDRPKRVLIFAVQLSIFLFAALLVYYGSILVMSPAVQQLHSPALWLPMYTIYSLMPIAAFFMAWHSILEMYRAFK